MNTQDKVISLREQGKTYGEIQTILGKKIAKSTLSYWCRNVPLPGDYKEKVRRLLSEGCSRSRAAALAKNYELKKKYHHVLMHQFEPLKAIFKDKQVSLIALAMLCLGEASKGEPFYLGNSDERIIRLFLGLIKHCFDFDIEKVRCTIQCRADQNIHELERYWMDVTNIPKRLFYKTRIDPRTIGKTTVNRDYKGVLRVDYFDSKIQQQLGVLYNLLADEFGKGR